MSITDELRECINEYSVFAQPSRLLRIADRIDAEYESMVSYWQGASYKDGYDEGFASADDWLAQHEDAMAEHGWVKLPLDADGEPIHVGDVMEVITSKQRAKACYMQMGPSGAWAVGLTKNCHWYDTQSLAHYHPPTVEDVLRAMLDALDVDVCADPDATIAEYAAKLRLAGDGE